MGNLTARRNDISQNAYHACEIIFLRIKKLIRTRNTSKNARGVASLTAAKEYIATVNSSDAKALPKVKWSPSEAFLRDLVTVFFLAVWGCAEWRGSLSPRYMSNNSRTSLQTRRWVNDNSHTTDAATELTRDLHAFERVAMNRSSGHPTPKIPGSVQK